MSNLDDLSWHGALEHGDAPHARTLVGVYYGIVLKNTDQGGDSKYRLKLRFPWLPAASSESEEESHWARVLVPMAGAERGAYFLPEPGDQVLVMFEHGDITRPIVIGAMWSTAEPPPETNSDGKNNLRVIKSRSGHRVILDDTGGGERVILCDSTRKNAVILDAARSTVTIQSSDGDIELLAPRGAVRLHGKKVNITTRSTLAGKGKQALHVTTPATLDVKATGDLRMQSQAIQINPGGSGPRKKKKKQQEPPPGAGTPAAAPDQQLAAKTAASPGGMPGGMGGMPGGMGIQGGGGLPDMGKLGGMAGLPDLGQLELTGIPEVDATLQGAIQGGVDRLIKGEGLEGFFQGMLEGGAGALTSELLDDLTRITIVDTIIAKFGAGLVKGTTHELLDGENLRDAFIEGLKKGGIGAASGLGKAVPDLLGDSGGDDEPDPSD